jgi:hypothetical protein
MDFNEYWLSLVNRMYREQAELKGDEDRFYRLCCIYGETTVDGIESYFERRFDEFGADMEALQSEGFGELASEFELARKLLFGSTPLDSQFVEATITRLSDEGKESAPVLAELSKIYDHLIPQLEQLADYKYSFGLAVGLFRDA